MYILMLFSTDIPICDGIASHVVTLAKQLSKRNHTVTLMTRGSWRGRVEFQYQSLKVIKAPFYRLYPLHVHMHGYFVRKAIEDLSPQPDLIHFHSPLVPPLPKKWPIVTSFHTPMLVDTAHVENIGLRTLLIKLMGKTTSYHIEKRLLAISDAVIAVSQGVADELTAYYGYESYIYPIPNIVDTDFYTPSSFSEQKKILLYIGRLSYRKGLFEIVNSAKDVIKQHPDVKYILIGSGPLEKLLRKAINKLRLDLNFIFCGEIYDPSKILHFYQQATVVLIPSYYESGPLTLLEAMACGKPIITTSTGLAKGLIENGSNAILVRPRSVRDLVEATIKLLSSEALCKKLGKAARRTIDEKISQDKNTDLVEEVYKYAIDKFRKSKKC